MIILTAGRDLFIIYRDKNEALPLEYYRASDRYAASVRHPGLCQLHGTFFADSVTEEISFFLYALRILFVFYREP